MEWDLHVWFAMAGDCALRKTISVTAGQRPGIRSTDRINRAGPTRVGNGARRKKQREQKHQTARAGIEKQVHTPILLGWSGRTAMGRVGGGILPGEVIRGERPYCESSRYRWAAIAVRA